MLERATTRMLPLVGRATDIAPVAPACCNACRTCMTTNLIGVVMSGASAFAYGIARVAGRRYSFGGSQSKATRHSLRRTAA
jgi:hypothetical protein